MNGRRALCGLFKKTGAGCPYSLQQAITMIPMATDGKKKKNKMLDAVKAEVINNNNSRSSSDASDISDTEAVIFGSFTQKELDILRTTFNQLKQRNKDELASKVISRVEKVDGAALVYKQAVDDIGGEWSPVSQGNIVISGIERCLVLLAHEKELQAMIAGLKAIHREHYNVQPEMMVDALRVSEPTILSELKTCHEHKEGADLMSGKSRCSVCRLWQKFFIEMYDMIMSPTTD